MTTGSEQFKAAHYQAQEDIREAARKRFKERFPKDEKPEIRFCLDCEYCHNAGWGRASWECHAPLARGHRDKITGKWPSCYDMRNAMRCSEAFPWFKEKGRI